MLGGPADKVGRRDGTIVLKAVAKSELWRLEEPHWSHIARCPMWVAETPANESDLDALTTRAGRRRGRK